MLITPNLSVLAFVIILEPVSDLVAFDPKPGLKKRAIFARLQFEGLFIALGRFEVRYETLVALEMLDPSL